MNDSALIRFIISLTWIIQLFISFPLWVPGGRDFFLVPAIEILPVRYSLAGDTALFIFLLVSLISLNVARLKNISIITVLLTSALFILEDITRFQPWVFIYSILLTAILALKEIGNRNRIIILLLGLTYSWSGFQKINHAFTEEIFPWLMSVYGLEDFFMKHKSFAMIPALTEMFAGLGLFFVRWWKISAWIITVIHILILVSIGPWAENWNKVIWPWNIAMSLLVLVTAYHKDFRDLRLNLLKKQPVLFYLVFFVAGILPVLNFFRMWDNHLSGSLYSGNNSEAIFYYHPDDRGFLPPETAPYLFKNEKTGSEFLLIDHWVIGELEAPFYPETRYFKYVGKKLCGCVEKKSGAGILITQKDKFTSKQKLVQFTCDQLR